MKKLLIVMMLLIIVMSGCKKDGVDPSSNGKFISLRPEVGVKMKSVQKSADPGDPILLTAKEIVEQAFNLSFINHEVSTFPSGVLSRGFGDELRDTVQMRLLVYATDVIKEDGSLKRDFIEGRDFVLQRQTYDRIRQTFIYDTIAYIPNGTVIEAERQIKLAYQQGDLDRCRYVMDQYFRFIPITGKQWRALPKVVE